ncbi:efflux RND transporter periplasmic adaptor subunit [uncultured Gimesia sp.]|uniref:efflux RND transporter periplasmic adaptor subunit n=1 Tax=uncultured Gimesia sp. TaxID=1678688 RepID=UPI002638B4CD|nr:efflux RND transporter periplasmic adaptor subunit [uncultured Gimesia sp.]
MNEFHARLLYLKYPGLLCSLIMIAGCNAPPPSPAMKPPTVTVAEPVQKTVVFNADFTGRLASVASVEIRARADGILEKIDFKPGSLVKKDELLFEIERDQYQATLDKSNAALKASQAQLKDAQATFERYKILVKKKAVTEEEFNNVTADRDKAEASVMASQADVDQAQINLNYTRIHAPITGEISRNLVDAGNLVGSGENTLLTSIVTMDPIYVYFDASERLLLDALKKRQIRINESAKNGKQAKEKEPFKVFIGLSNEEGYPHEGVYDFANNKVDPGTGTIQLRAIFKNTEGLLYPGVYVRVRVPGDPIPNAVLVHDVSIGTDLAGKYLLVIGKEDLVERRSVEIGQLESNMRVILKGIKPGEKYIYEGIQRARPGRPVTIKSEPAESTKQKKTETETKSNQKEKKPASASKSAGN